MSELGLPTSWRVLPLGAVCQVVSGATPKTAVSENWGGDVPWLTPDDLSKNRSKVVTGGARSLTEVGYASCSTRLVPPGSVLFTSRAPIGYVAIAGREICTNQGFKSAVPSDDIDSEFLYYQLQFLTPEIRSRASGTTFLEIGGKGFAATQVSIAPLAEQQRIVEILEEQFSHLDAALVSIRTVREKAKVFRRSLLQAAFSGSLSDELVKFEPVPLQDLVDAKADITDGPFGSNLKSEHYTTSGPRVVRLANISSGSFINSFVHISTEHFATLQKHRVLAGDVLVATLGESIPRACIAPEYLGDAIVKADCIRIRPSRRVTPSFLSYAINSPVVRASAASMIQGVTRPRINLGTLRTTVIPLPPLAEQCRITELIEKQFSRLDDALEITNQLELRITSARRSLLHAAFSGTLTAQWRETHNG